MIPLFLVFIGLLACKPRASGDDPWYAKATYEEVK